MAAAASDTLNAFNRMPPSSTPPSSTPPSSPLRWPLSLQQPLSLQRQGQSHRFNASTNHAPHALHPRTTITLTDAEGNPHDLQLILYEGNLYRAEEYRPDNATATRANAYYRNDPKVRAGHVHFFTTRYGETRSYENRYGVSAKQWRTELPLRLLDLLHLPTRMALESVVPPSVRADLAVSFPVHEDRVLRVSTDDTAAIDRRLLGALCALDGVDGYYMENQAPGEYRGQAVQNFHSEIGLCESAFSKLQLMGYSDRRVVKTVKFRRSMGNHKSESAKKASKSTMRRRSLTFDNHNANRPASSAMLSFNNLLKGGYTKKSKKSKKSKSKKAQSK